MGRSFLWIGLALSGVLHADDRVRKALDRLVEEASVFQRSAPDVVAEETLQQRALKIPKRQFSPHFGTESRPAPQWQTREIVSEYTYASIGAGSIRELRKPVSVDGKPLPNSGNALERLSAIVRSAGDESKIKLLEQFEKLGLLGTVTDFGQLILLFDSRSLDHYEFTAGEEKIAGADRVFVVRYRQREGAAALSVWRGGKLTRQSVSGEIWFRESDLFPVRITIASTFEDRKQAVREEAEVEYGRTAFGVPVPASVVHREYRGTDLQAENRFTYSPFRTFGANSEIRFEAR